jgi:hypothetical protein
MATSLVTWADLLGRDGYDNPLSLPKGLGAECLNVTLQKGTLGSKRPGSTAVSLTGDSFTGVNHLATYIPGQDPTAAELWIVSADATPKVLRVTSAAAAALSLKDAIATSPQITSFASLNGKLYVAYDSTVNRLHVYNPAESTTAVRRAGLPAPAAPSVANTGSGAYTATQRWYCVAWRAKVSGVIVREGPYSTATAFTPSGSGTAARVTEPTAASEGETHWVLYASADSADGPFYEIAETVVATTTYDDSAAPSTYNVNAAAPVVGAQYPFPSVKYLLSDGTRLFGLGVWESSAGTSVAPVSGRLYWTPPYQASSGHGDDDERFQDTATQADWLNLNINAGGQDRGLAGPINNVIFAFQSKGIDMILSTGQATAPFKRVNLSREYGSVSNDSTVVAPDEAGNLWVYFLDPAHGPCRVGLGGQIQRLDKDVSDLWADVNLSASTVVAWGAYDPANRRIYWEVATGSSNTPDRALVFHIPLAAGSVGPTFAIGQDVRGGWATWTGAVATGRHGVMFASALTASRPLTEVLYFGNATQNLAKLDASATADYDTTTFQGYVTSGAFTLGPEAHRNRLLDAYLSAAVSSGATIQETITKDWGAETLTDTVSLTAAGSETYVRPRLEGTDLADLIVFQVRLGDAAAVAKAWTLVEWVAVVEPQIGAH